MAKAVDSQVIDSSKESSLRSYVSSAMGQDVTDDDVSCVLRTLQQELCSSVEKLEECWDEVCPALPALARSRLKKSLQSQRTLFEDAVPQGAALGNWLLGSLLAALAVALPTTIGFVGWDESEETLDFSDALWYKACGPLIFLGVLQVVLALGASPRIGWDMIQEASEDADLREALKNSMSTQGVVSALFLTIIFAMLQIDPIHGEPTLFIMQWYQGLLVLSLSFTLVGTAISLICLLYLEPLSGRAAVKCVFANFAYFGEPAALSGFAILNTIGATTIWVFGTFGIGAGILASFASFWCVLRPLVVYVYMSQWHNPEIEHLRDARATAKRQLATTGASNLSTAVRIQSAQEAVSRALHPQS